jgi:integrase
VNSLSQGAALENVQRWLGHSNITTTQVYTRLAAPPAVAAEADPVNSLETLTKAEGEGRRTKGV